MWGTLLAVCMGLGAKAVALVARAGASPVVGILEMIDPRVGLAALAFVASLTGGYLWGHSDAASACQARAIAAQLAITRATLAKVDEAKSDADDKARDLAARNTSLQQKVQDYATQLDGLQLRVTGNRPIPKSPGPACLLNAGDLDRLRALQ